MKLNFSGRKLILIASFGGAAVILFCIVSAWLGILSLAQMTYVFSGYNIFAPASFDLPRTLPAENIKVVGHLGGETKAVAIQGNYAFVGSGPELNVFDVSDTKQIRKVGSLLLPGLIQHIDIDRNHAYIADGRGGLRIVDISNVSQPREVANFGKMAAPSGVKVIRDHAYLASGIEGVFNLDVHEPEHPRMPFLGAFQLKAEEPFDACALASSGNLLLAADNSLGMRVFDISNPNIPRELAMVPSEHHVEKCVAVDGAIAVSAGECPYPGLHVYDLTVPSKPKQATLKSPEYWYASAVALSHGRAYIATDGGLWIVDVSQPLKPVQIAAWNACKFLRDIAVQGEMAYLVNGDGDLLIVDIGNPAQPKLLTSYRLPHCPYKARVYRDSLLIEDYPGTIAVSRSMGGYEYGQIKQFFRLGEIRNLEISGDHVYVLDDRRKEGCFLTAFNTSDQTAVVLKEAGKLKIDGEYGPMCLSGERAYIATADGIEAIGLSQGPAPVKAGFFKIPESIDCLAAFENRLFIASHKMVPGEVTKAKATLSLMQVSVPAETKRLSEWSVAGKISYVLVDSAHVFVIAGQTFGNKYLYILDCLPDGTLRERGNIKVLEPKCMIANGKTVYVSAWLNGLKAIDISDSDHPKEVGNINTEPLPAEFTDLCFTADGTIVATTEKAGLYLLKYLPDGSG